MPRAELNALPTIIGSMPQTSAADACEQILHYLKDIPAWPQLPRRSFLEDMCVQFSQGFPGLVVQDERIYVDRSKDINRPLEGLYAAYLENNIDKYPVNPEYAAGLHRFLKYADMPVRAVKGQIVGPITWGMTVTDNDKKAIAYDDVLSDAAAKLLKLKAAWMEKELQIVSRNTLVFVDEPYLTSFGSSYCALSREKVITLLEEVFSGISGLKGVHCCGNTDWSLLLSTSLDILSFDAYNFAESLTLYPQAVKKFLSVGGAIAWGIVPTDESILRKETAASLQNRLEEAVAPFTRKGIDLPFRQLIAQSLLTPACGLAQLSLEGAARALELLTAVSEKIRSKWG